MMIAPALSSADLAWLERILEEGLNGLFPFKDLALFGAKVPASSPDGPPLAQAVITGKPVWDFERNRIFLPLTSQGSVRAVARLDGIDGLDKISRQGPYLSRLASLVLEKFLLTQALVIDPLTGLFSRAKLLEELGRMLDLALSLPDSGKPRLEVEGAEEAKAGVALVLVRVLETGALSELYGRRFLRSAYRHLAGELLKAAGQDSCPTRLSETVLAWLEPGLTAEEAMEKLTLWAERVKPLTAPDGKTVAFQLAGGVAAFPEDLPGPWEGPGNELAEDLARDLEERAGRSLSLAVESGPGSFLSLAEVRRRCGRVVEVMPLDRVVVDLGRAVGVEEGMRFYVAHPSEKSPEVYKAELTLIAVNQEQSTAEITALEDNRFPVQAGDHLVLAEERGELKLRASDERIIDLDGQELKVVIDEATGLAGPRSLGPVLERLAESADQLLLVVARVDGLIRQRSLVGQKEADRLLVRLADLGQEVLEPALIGRAGVESLAFVLTDRSEEAGLDLAWMLRKRAEDELEQNVTLGLAAYPFLETGPAETLERAFKALDHALFPEAEPVVLFNAVSLNVSGDRLYYRGDLKAAVAEYEKAISVDPENVNVLNSLGVCYGETSRLEEASELFERVARLTPDDFMAWYNLGQVKRRQGRADEAREALEKAAELNKDDFAVLYSLGQLFLDQGQASKACHWFSLAAKAEDARPVVHRWLGEALARTGQPEKAMRHFRAAVKANPHDAASLSWLGRLYLDKQGDKEVALSLTRQAVDLAPENSLYRSRLGWALINNLKPSEALSEFQAALSGGERSPEVLWGMGRALAVLGRVDEAAAAMAEAAELSPEDENIQADLARLKAELEAQTESSEAEADEAEAPEENG